MKSKDFSQRWERSRCGELLSLWVPSVGLRRSGAVAAGIVGSARQEAAWQRNWGSESCKEMLSTNCVDTGAQSPGYTNSRWEIMAVSLLQLAPRGADSTGSMVQEEGNSLQPDPDKERDL